MKLLLLRYGEIALKGRNRRFFERQLMENIQRRLEGFVYTLESEMGRIYLHYEDPQIPLLVKDTFGLVEVCVCERIPLEEKLLEDKIIELLGAQKLQNKTFKIDTRRSNKNYARTSPEMNRHMGGVVLRAFPELRVDVHHPDYLIEIEIRKDFYLYLERYKALGGMPYGTAGRSVILMSGGIDSPVAGYQMARRGVRLIPLHFHAMPFTSLEALEKVKNLVRRISYYTGPLPFYHVNLLNSQRMLKEHCDEKYFTLLQRRLMTRLATELARKEGALSLITGENLAQVASQTMEGINCTNAVTDRPIFRPLISFDKEDIVKIAKEIGTYETSILPFDDACTVFLPKKVVTRPHLKELEVEEEKIDLDQLFHEAWSTLTKESLY